MSQRRRTAVPTAMIAALTATLTAAATMSLSACEFDVAPGSISPGSIPVPFSVAPVPSASVGQPAYVCTAIYKILTDGAVRLAGHISSDGSATGGDQDELRDTFAAMAADIEKAGATSTDPAQREKIMALATSLDQGAKAADPQAYLSGEFPTIGQELDGTCT
ncbi:hypothetical protein FB565_003425 [Actinoplanes lutulentus]|uniref:hypothetical protein n=1 Tax=Actinoplanes lutulentus TaxID=1287878 RepID=UPI0018343A3E|nr:hypothetical protein [Actinoplanes lutulentus]MBB2943696.1 hypothetical protein [Actinoplanes lutulentus]